MLAHRPCTLRSQLALGQLVDNRGTKLPSARNMYRLLWACDLEQQAHDWLATCPSGPQLSKGENFYRGPASGLSAWRDMNKKAVTEWWKVYRNVNGPGSSAVYTSSHEGTMIDSYTQMAWAKTRYLGCSIATCDGDFVESCRYRVV
ncbi:unnamed protein product [Strongylus vulgaris]|uniref:SCP domain-containing protein n=1 Tax=Strongylus vulgaris TaxID=40348 RepID=A0A3P7IW43_STRVU|nr:unnamed protein product [Strongylus vulgaris]